MNLPDTIDLSSDEDIGEADVKTVILESVSVHLSNQQARSENNYISSNVFYPKIEKHVDRQGSEENRYSNTGKMVQNGGVDGSSPCSTCHVYPQQSRKFWKAGEYDVGHSSKAGVLNDKNHIQVHPKFLHSNATSHKWVLGAIAELLDNAVDETQNGATFVSIDKITNPRDGSPALLIQDDGGGMDPESVRRCMSLGYSQKETLSAIGQYGNGFKTSTMRLGADAIVFSRNRNTRTSTQSIGLLSYSFLMQTGLQHIVVPMVDYEWSPVTGGRRHLLRSTEENFSCNLSTLLQWSPYSTEANLLKQFDDIGHHGTKVIVYNLWLNDDGEIELDFVSNEEDIQISGAPKKKEGRNTHRLASENHIANRFHYSLRDYSSMLYLKMPKDFRIILRGRVVQHLSIDNELKFREYILYKPQIGGGKEASVITTIGFIKEAPIVGIHGFNVYHKNRLILPFWKVVHDYSSRGRGVVGVLEANFIEPAHDKQDFEKTSLLQKLENRLKEMTFEYWDLHCGLIGYKVQKKPRTTFLDPARTTVQFESERQADSSSSGRIFNSYQKSFRMDKNLGKQDEPVVPPDINALARLSAKRKMQDHLVAPEASKRVAVGSANASTSCYNHDAQLCTNIGDLLQSQEAKNLMAENKKLHEQCTEYEKQVEKRRVKVGQLERELREVQREYAKLLLESQALNAVKAESL